MIPVQQALEAVLERAARMPAERVPLTEALGRVAAEPVHSDMDMPPFDRSAVDGFAVRSADCMAAGGRLRVVGEVQAGRMPTVAVGAGEAVKIMTGAPVPAGADAVVMVERTRTEEGLVRLEVAVAAGAGVAPRGQDIRSGALVLPAGAEITPAAIGALAAVGTAEPLVFGWPAVAVLATGDELVGISAKPAGAQIRNSNSYGLAAQVRDAGCLATILPPAPDTAEGFRRAAEEGLRGDVLILSGGVSMGDYDLVPGVLAEMGVAIHVHKVAMRPGKPFLLGTRAGKLVFGLPGNPVSSFVCFELFVRPALCKMMGRAVWSRPTVNAESAGVLPANGDRAAYLPARLRCDETGKRVAERMDWKGSADLFGLARADALLIRPAGAPAAPAGTMVPVMPLHGW